MRARRAPRSVYSVTIGAGDRVASSLGDDLARRALGRGELDAKSVLGSLCRHDSGACAGARTSTRSARPRAFGSDASPCASVNAVVRSQASGESELALTCAASTGQPLRVDDRDRQRLARLGQDERDLLAAALGHRDDHARVGLVVVVEALAVSTTASGSDANAKEPSLAVRVARSRRPALGGHDDPRVLDGAVVRVEDPALERAAFAHDDVDVRLAARQQRDHFALGLDVLRVTHDCAHAPGRRRRSRGTCRRRA